MTTFATDSLFIICFNTLKHCFTVDLVAALGGIRVPFSSPLSKPKIRFFTTKSIRK